MGLFRRSALEGVGGWNEWCISEDTEASLRVLKAGWSGLYIPRCFGRGIVPPTFAGLNTQRHRWCFGAMQILRLHWRSLMPWDRSPDNHLSRSQRRDYLMASAGWFRDLFMLVFALLLFAVAGLVLSGSGFALTPLGGDRSLLPMSLIVIASICMMWTLRHWTPISRRRSVLGLVISLSASLITAIACLEGIARREGVFLRTSKTGSNRHRLRAAIRLSRWEGMLAVALYSAAAILSASRHPPIVLIIIIALQGTVYACSPIASLWNLRAQLVPAVEYRRRYQEQRLRQVSGRPSVRVVRPAAFVILAAVLGAGAAALSAPQELLPGSPVHHARVGPPVHPHRTSASAPTATR
jgi:hypothetical protein